MLSKSVKGSNMEEETPYNKLWPGTEDMTDTRVTCHSTLSPLQVLGPRADLGCGRWATCIRITGQTCHRCKFWGLISAQIQMSGQKTEESTKLLRHQKPLQVIVKPSTV